MNPGQSSRVVLAYCGTFFAAAGFVALLASFGSGGIERAGATPIENRPAATPVSNAQLADMPRAPATSDVAIASTDAATVESSVTEAVVETTAAPNESKSIAAAALPDRSETLLAPATSDVAVAGVDAATVESSVTEAVVETTAAPEEPKSFAVAALPPQSETPSAEPAASTPDPTPQDVKAPASKLEGPDECLVADICIDQYLWALYQRAPKQDTNKVHGRKKVMVMRKGKKVTVTRRFVTLVDADFTWKDPKAAERAGMPMMQYVIGGMNRSFKRKLLYMLLAAEEAGLSPGITSAFRDDYRQSIATGQKAAANRSYHGGSLRGGYGHGLAADVVSVKGATTRGQRWASNVILWQWIDEHGKAYGIGRPYLDRDAPHVAPIDGREYATHYRPPKVQQAGMDKKKSSPAAQGSDGVVRTASAKPENDALGQTYARRDE